MSWSKEMDEQLRALIAERFTGSEIAAKLGKSRSAVLGRAHRMKLKVQGISSTPRQPRRPTGKSPLLVAPFRPKASSVKPLDDIYKKAAAVIFTPPMHLPTVEAPSRGRIMINKLTVDTCRWPLWDDAACRDSRRFYCGAQTVKDKPYCASHASISYRLPASRKGAKETVAD